jgi:hypothetical protein
VLTVLDNAVSRDPIIYEDVATDTIGMAVLPIPGRYVSLDDGLLASDALTLGYHLTLADIIGSKDVLAFTPVLTLTDAVGVTETLALKYLPGATVTETVGVLDAPAGAVKYLIVVSDRPGMRDATVVGVPASLSEGVGVQAAVATVRALKLAEALGVAEALGGAGKYGQTITDRVRLRDALLRFLSEDMLDTVNLAATLVAQRELYPTLTQGIGIDDATTQAFLLRVTATDEIELTATQALKMIFAPTVTDGVEITAAYISPNGNFTTWAINTRTAAVTEYSNYTFNSFAQTGHKYLGASDSGLYELNGDKDVNTDIIAHIKSGFAQFGGSRFTSFKAAYLGMRGEGDFILKLETGDGKTYTYAVVGKDMQTTRVHMGKGLRARYFSFELISTGQDFDLDDIEFLPLVVQRRV